MQPRCIGFIQVKTLSIGNDHIDQAIAVHITKCRISTCAQINHTVLKKVILHTHKRRRSVRALIEIEQQTSLVGGVCICIRTHNQVKDTIVIYIHEITSQKRDHFRRKAIAKRCREIVVNHGCTVLARARFNEHDCCERVGAYIANDQIL